MAVNRHALVQIVQAVQPLRSVQSPTSFLPCDAGDEGGGLINLNDLSELNLLDAEGTNQVWQILTL